MSTQTLNTTVTLETVPPSAKASMQGMESVDVMDIVRKNAKRKADNGSTFSSTKGKTALLNCCVDEIRSRMSLPLMVDGTKEKTQLPADVFAKLKDCLNRFWHNEAAEIVQKGIDKDAKFTVRRDVLMTKLDDDLTVNRTRTDTVKVVHQPDSHEIVLCDTFGLTAAKSRLDTMLEKIGMYDREEIDTQRKKVDKLEQLIIEGQKSKVTGSK